MPKPTRVYGTYTYVGDDEVPQDLPITEACVVRHPRGYCELKFYAGDKPMCIPIPSKHVENGGRFPLGAEVEAVILARPYIHMTADEYLSLPVSPR